MTNQNSIRRQNEGDRTPEFKAGRDQLVTDINDFLDTLRARQAQGNSTKLGLLLTSPRMKQTSLGRTGPNTHLLAKEYSPGVALYQENPDDGGPFSLEVVQIKNEEIAVAHVTGTPVISRLLQDAGGMERDHVSKYSEASFGVEDVNGVEGPSYYTFDMYSDGSVIKRYKDLRGVNVSIPVSTAEGIGTAQLAFNQVKSDLL